jgi:hypothetical protein
MVYIFLCIFTIAIITLKNREILDSEYYRIGPSDGLYVLGVQIKSFKTYIALVIFSLINIVFREINQDIINPWLINHMQNISCPKELKEMKDAMFINSVFTLFTWLDWFISINMITTQIDFLFFESIFNVGISILGTYIYYKKSPRLDHLTIEP